MSCALPAGSAAGDNAYLFIAGYAGFTIPVGWTDLGLTETGGVGSTITGNVISKTLDAADIIAGAILVVQGATATWACAVMVGANSGVRPDPTALGSGTGANGDTNLNSDSTVETGDYCLLFGAVRNWSDETFTAPAAAVQLQFHPDALGASGCLYEYEALADGAFTATHHTLWGGANYQAIVPLYEAVPPVEIFVQQANVYALAETGPEMQITSGGLLAVAIWPAEFLHASEAGLITVSQAAPIVAASEAGMLVVARGRIANPRARAWTFTLDGHDFYVLRLGDQTTLIYDVYSEQWIEWTSQDLPFWRPSAGQTWLGAAKLAEDYGSTVVVGDDTFGLLWFLNPEQPYDEHPDELRTPQQLAFERIVTGQVLATGRQQIPVYAVFVGGDNYGLSGVDFTPEVRLEGSDDQGRTFDDYGSITVPADYNQALAYEWLSLGQISEPGRIFRIVDNGVFARIDSMDMNDDAR
jgi:hypothetical protein